MNRFEFGCFHLIVMRCILIDLRQNIEITLHFGRFLFLRILMDHQTWSNLARHFDFMILQMSFFDFNYFCKNHNLHFYLLACFATMIVHIKLYLFFIYFLLSPLYNFIILVLLVCKNLKLLLIEDFLLNRQTFYFMHLVVLSIELSIFHLNLKYFYLNFLSFIGFVTTFLCWFPGIYFTFRSSFFIFQQVTFLE